MKNKKVIILIVGGLILTIVGSILLVSNGFKSEQKKLKQTMDTIVNDYTTFKTKVEEFSKLREQIYSDVMNSQYYSEIFNNYSANVEKLTKYEELVTEIDNVSKNLKKNCTERKYSDQDVTNKCNAFIINYEQSINYFINDITRFNEKIEEYNKWRTTENTDKKYTELGKYNTKYTEYVDINGDKKESGKAEK